MDRFTNDFEWLNQAQAEIADFPEAALDKLRDHLMQYKQLLGDSWPDFARSLSQHSIQKLLHESPFSRRAWLKPRGYPGDAVTIDYTYGLNPLDSVSSFGQRLYQWEYGSMCCQSVRSRRDYIARQIDEAALARPGARVLAVACGHLREARLSEAVRSGSLAEWIALDQDVDSLRVVEQEHPDVQTVCCGVQTLLVGEPRWKNLDLIYAAGLYDYLSDPFARRLTSRLFEMLRPGGRLLIANFHPDSPGSATMEAWMDWWLIYRTEQQMDGLASRIPPERLASRQAFRADDPYIAYLDLVRAD